MAKRWDVEELGALLGREPGPKRGWLWPALGGLAVGAACGLALGLAFGPKRRRELGGWARQRLGEAKGQAAPTSAGAPSVSR